MRESPWHIELVNALWSVPFDDEVIKDILKSKDEEQAKLILEALYIAYENGVQMGLDIAHDAFDEAQQQILHENVTSLVEGL